tara:strand:+ start:1340 stop:1984 length:645 start_codon:yes stop_codon:yes gene_type:complete
LLIFKKNKFKGLILDFDGTVVDSEIKRLNTYKLSIKQIAGINIEIQKHKLIGRTEKENLNYLCTKYGIKDEQIKIKEQRKNLLLDEAKKGFNKISVTSKIIDNLFGKIPMIIASNSSTDYLKAALKKTSLEKIPFVSINDVNHGKPEPDLFIMASKMINVSNEKCLVLEDSEIGCQAAKNAKMDYIQIVNFESKKNNQVRADDQSASNKIVDLF